MDFLIELFVEQYPDDDQDLKADNQAMVDYTVCRLVLDVS